MNGYWRAVVILGLGAVVVGPLLTLHATITHVLGATTLGAPPRDPGLAWLLFLSLSSLVPIVLLGLRIPTVVRSARLVSTLAKSGDRRVLMGFDVIELPTDDLLVFTAGLRRPRTFISRGALEALDAEQIKAALLHERAHISAHDTSWRTALIMVSRAYPFVPRLRAAVDALHTDAEIRADRQAVDHGASPIALFDALVKVATSPTAHLMATAQFSDGAIESRLENLAGYGGRMSPPAPWLIGASITGMAALPLAAHALLAYEIICHSVMT